jgi:hypothetical protein
VPKTVLPFFLIRLCCVDSRVMIISLSLGSGWQSCVKPQVLRKPVCLTSYIISYARAYNFELQMFSVGDYDISSVLIGYNDVNF